MADTNTRPPLLKESIIKDALSTFCWKKLEHHLDAIKLNEGGFEQLLGYLRRCNELILKYPNDKMAARRADFFAKLRQRIRDDLGAPALDRLKTEIHVLDLAEQGYRGILGVLDRCEISRLPPGERVNSYVSRAAEQFIDLQRRWHASIKNLKELNAPQVALLYDDNGNPYSPDGVLTALVECLTMSLVMEGYKNRWFDHDSALVLPDFTQSNERRRFQAGSTEVLAQSWRRWERMQQRRRFLGGELVEYSGTALPKGVPPGTKKVIEYRPLQSDFFDFAANERLNDRLTQTYIEMAVESEIFKNVRGIGADVGLPPEAFVCEEEIHSAISLSEILGYAITADQERPAGLRLVEWLRGYSVLKVLATERHNAEPSNSAGVCPVFTYGEVISLLERTGLRNGAAENFVQRVTLKRFSRDLFDCPLIKLADGRLLLFAPGVISANHARVILSILSSLEEPLSKKGKAFERDMSEFLKKRGFSIFSLKAKRDGEEYEYDLILLWGDYLFLFECKNHNLSSHDPVQAYYFDLERQSDAQQVNRLVDGLRKYPDILTEHIGADAVGKTIVPCVLNSLPFALPGTHDGVYFTDSSLLKRFFQERNFNVKVRHHLEHNIKFLHRTAYHSWWAGDKPSPEDLLRQLEEPFQLKLMHAHTRAQRSYFAVAEDTLAVTQELTRTEVTIESLAAVGGADASWVRKEIAAVSAGVNAVRARRERQLLRKQDRAWREKKKHET